MCWYDVINFHYNIDLPTFYLIPYAIVSGERQAVLAPPETEWYHGRLDRYTSEERLWAAGKLGSYLGKNNPVKKSVKTRIN